MLSNSGEVTTIAGTGVAGITNSGSGTNVMFNEPKGVTVDTLGNVYVADYASNTIRKLSGKKGCATFEDHLCAIV